MVALFVLDDAELPIVGEAAQPAAVHCGYPAGEVYSPMFSHLSDLLPPFQTISHSKNLGESKHLKSDQTYRENYKDL